MPSSDGDDGLPSAEPVDKQVQRLQDVVERLEATVERQAERLDELEAEVARKDARIDDLESEVAEASALARAGANKAEQVQTALAGDEWLDIDPDAADFTPVLARLPDGDEPSLADLQRSVREEQIERSRADAKLKRELKCLAAAVDEDLDALPVEDEDKIARLANQGPEDVVDCVYTVHERAHDVLANLTDWADAHDDANGRYLLLPAPRARERLELLRDERLQPVEVRRVFEKIEELAADSHRTVSVGKTDDGRNRLKIEFEGR